MQSIRNMTGNSWSIWLSSLQFTVVRLWTVIHTIRLLSVPCEGRGSKLGLAGRIVRSSWHPGWFILACMGPGRNAGLWTFEYFLNYCTYFYNSHPSIRIFKNKLQSKLMHYDYFCKASCRFRSYSDCEHSHRCRNTETDAGLDIIFYRGYWNLFWRNINCSFGMPAWLLLAISNLLSIGKWIQNRTLWWALYTENTKYLQ